MEMGQSGDYVMNRNKKNEKRKEWTKFDSNADFLVDERTFGSIGNGPLNLLLLCVRSD